MKDATIRQRIERQLLPDEATGCLLWQGCLNSKGYGVIGYGGKRYLVHRVAYELNVGPIPEGLTIDHVYARGCRHKHCVNVAHLEPVTSGENTRRSIPYRACKPRPYRERVSPLLTDEFWRDFHKWAGPQEWAELDPSGRARALAATPRRKRPA